MRENRERKVVKLSLDPETMEWFNKHNILTRNGYRNQNLASRAVEFYCEYSKYRKGFFIRLIDNHFSEIRALLRKIGRAKKRVLDTEGKYWNGN